MVAAVLEDRKTNPTESQDRFKAYYKAVDKIARKLCRDPEESEDLRQRVLFKIVRRERKTGQRIDQGIRSNFAGYLYRMTTNEHKAMIREKTTLSRGGGVTPLPLDQGDMRIDPIDRRMPAPDRAIATREAKAILRKAVYRLPESHRVAVEAQKLGGLGYKETAEVLGIGMSALKTRIHRGTLMLKDLLSPLLGISGKAA